MDTVTLDGLTVTLTQDAYVSDDSETYEAHAADDEGNVYKVFWRVICTDTDDQSNCCDWDKPFHITLVETA